MKLSKEQKDIIAHIQSNEITDIYSFVKYYGLGAYISHDKSAIENFFYEHYGKNKYKCKKDDFYNLDCIVEEIDDNYVWAKPHLDYFNSNGQVIKYNEDIVYGFSLYEQTYICEDINKIVSFIALWQYLKSEGLIIELPKSCTETDMGLFLRKEYLEHDEVFFQDKNLRLGDMSINVANFLDWNYVLDKKSFERCLPYLNIQLYPAPELSTYITKKHKTLEEIREGRNMQIAFASVLIALITSIASIVISLQDRGYYNELKEINNSLQEIHTDLSIKTNQETDTEQSVEDLPNVNK